jgi:N-carbamoyl-L-amino-acid hydrolase
VPIGIVTGITGRQAFDLRIRGGANHAGTTPMDLRHDALAAAAEIVLAVEALPGPGSVRVATVGHLVVAPNVRNVVPGDVTLGVELRDADSGVLDDASHRLDALLTDIAARRDLAIETRWGQRVPPQDSDPRILASTRRVVDELGLLSLDLPSGAGHDAQVIGQAVPTGMIFVPSLGGLSHTPGERTTPEHLVTGAEVLLRTVLELDRTLT